jgi:hypothetical protein
VRVLAILTWDDNTQNAGIRHKGSMAQDFHAAFELAETPTGIRTADAGSVALATSRRDASMRGGAGRYC